LSQPKGCGSSGDALRGGRSSLALASRLYTELLAPVLQGHSGCDLHHGPTTGGGEENDKFRESRLFATVSAEPGFNDIERTVYSSIKGYGTKGIPLAEISKLVATRISGIESKLAKLGLRPSAAESIGCGYAVVVPLILLLGIGLVKLFLGVSRDKPVGFLLAFLFLTVVVAIIVASGRKKLTPAGESLLERMRLNTSATQYGAADSLLGGIAWSGVTGIAHDETLAGLDSKLRKEISLMGNSGTSSASSLGGSTGCSSGCGGGMRWVRKRLNGYLSLHQQMRMVIPSQLLN
jgi:uncharacterized protein (TIGR04222 family)